MNIIFQVLSHWKLTQQIYTQQSWRSVLNSAITADLAQHESQQCAQDLWERKRNKRNNVCFPCDNQWATETIQIKRARHKLEEFKQQFGLLVATKSMNRFAGHSWLSMMANVKTNIKFTKVECVQEHIRLQQRQRWFKLTKRKWTSHTNETNQGVYIFYRKSTYSLFFYSILWCELSPGRSN